MAGTKIPPSMYTPLWYRALEAEIGIAIPSNEPVILTNDLYTARQQAADPALEAIILTKMKSGEVWLVKKSVELD